MTEHEQLKERSFRAFELSEIARLKLEVEVTDWQPCGCCRIGKRPRRPGTSASNLRWYKVRWHRTYCKVPSYELHLPEKNITATMAKAILEFWDFLHAPFLDQQAAGEANKYPALVESEAEHEAAVERLRLRAQWAHLPTTDLRRITLYKRSK